MIWSALNTSYIVQLQPWTFNSQPCLIPLEWVSLLSPTLIFCSNFWIPESLQITSYPDLNPLQSLSYWNHILFQPFSHFPLDWNMDSGLSPGSCVWIHPFMKRVLALSKPSGVFPSFHLLAFHRWFWCVQACLMGTSPESLSQGPSPLRGRDETRISVSALQSIARSY